MLERKSRLLAREKALGQHSTLAHYQIFKVILEGRVLGFDGLPQWVREHFVPILYRGPFEIGEVLEHREGLETVSGKGLHIREGAVLTPLEPRPNAEGHDLAVKLISSAYVKKETGEELS